MQSEKKKTKAQTTLDGVVQKLNSKEFTRERVRDAVTKLVVCDDQVSTPFSRCRFTYLGRVVTCSARQACFPQLFGGNEDHHDERGLADDERC